MADPIPKAMADNHELGEVQTVAAPTMPDAGDTISSPMYRKPIRRRPVPSDAHQPKQDKTKAPNLEEDVNQIEYLQSARFWLTVATYVSVEYHISCLQGSVEKARYGKIKNPGGLTCYGKSRSYY